MIILSFLVRHKFKIIFALFWIVVLGIVLISFTKNKNPRVLGAQAPVKKPVLLIDNGIEFQFMSAESELADVFSDIGIEVYPEDKVSVLVDPVLGLGTRIKIRRATAVTINDGGKIKTFRTWKETVKQLLDEKGIKLSDLDRVSLSLDTTLTSDMEITIVRVRTEETTEKLAIAFKTVYKDDPNTYIGRSYVSQSGKNGEKEVVFKLTYENKELVSKEPIAEKILTKAQNKIVFKGTRRKVTVRCGGYNNLIEDAAAENGLDPNSLCILMRKESNFHWDSVGCSGQCFGLFQYKYGFWTEVSCRAGYCSASIWDAKVQIYTTAWAWANGYRGRWPY